MLKRLTRAQGTGSLVDEVSSTLESLPWEEMHNCTSRNWFLPHEQPTSASGPPSLPPSDGTLQADATFLRDTPDGRDGPSQTQDPSGKENGPAKSRKKRSRKNDAGDSDYAKERTSKRPKKGTAGVDSTSSNANREY